MDDSRFSPFPEGAAAVGSAIDFLDAEARSQAELDQDAFRQAQDEHPDRDYLDEVLPPKQFSAEELKNAHGGELFKNYRRFIPWLRPYWDKGTMPERETEKTAWQGAVACEGGWAPIASAWDTTDSNALWLSWEKLLPLICDETVNEIWVQRIVNGDSPTPAGYLDVLSEGLLGVRIHPELRMKEAEILNGFTRILSKSANGSYYTDKNTDGVIIIQSPLEAPGFRLAGGVPPVSIAPFIALRIPSRVRPELEHLVGAEVFGKDYNQAMVCPGSPLPVPIIDPLERAMKALEANGEKGRPMLPVTVLQYLRASALVGWNSVYSGATSSAKTTTLNAAISLLPLYWRVVTMEVGVGELKPPHINWLPLFAAPDLKDSKGNQLMNEEKVLSLALRLSPKPIPCGEIRGVEGDLWVRATTTGHESSPTTIHSGSPDEAIMRLANDMILKANPGMSETAARIKACKAANIVIQLAKEDRLVEGKVIAFRRCVGVYEIQITGGFIAQDQKVKLVPVFETRVDEKGHPSLVWVGKENGSTLQAELKAQFKLDGVPEWLAEGV